MPVSSGRSHVQSPRLAPVWNLVTAINSMAGSVQSSAVPARLLGSGGRLARMGRSPGLHGRRIGSRILVRLVWSRLSPGPVGGFAFLLGSLGWVARLPDPAC